METTKLGKSGLSISRIILGCMSFGTSKWYPWVLEDEDKVLNLMKSAYDAGIRTFDTADVYSNGLSEKFIGKFIVKFNIPREKLVILTKVYYHVGKEDSASTIGWPMSNDVINEHGLSRKHILAAADASTKRLGTYIDLLQIHRLDHSVPKEEIMEALHDVVKSGKARYLGASNLAAYEFAQLQDIADRKGWTKFISVQNYYNLIYREEEREMISLCKEIGVGIIPWSPIAQGQLARPFGDKSTVRGQNNEWLINESDTDREIISRVEKIAKDRGVSMALVSTAWVLSKGANPIVGITKPERIQEAIEALKFKFSDEELKYLEEPYVHKPIFGYWPTD